MHLLEVYEESLRFLRMYTAIKCIKYPREVSLLSSKYLPPRGIPITDATTGGDGGAVLPPCAQVLTTPHFLFLLTSSVDCLQ